MPVRDVVPRIASGVRSRPCSKRTQEYELIDEESCMELAQLNAKYGVNKFSFVTSGRSLSNKNIDKLCVVCREDQTGDEDKPLRFHGFADERAVAKIEKRQV